MREHLRNRLFIGALIFGFAGAGAVTVMMVRMSERDNATTTMPPGQQAPASTPAIGLAASPLVPAVRPSAVGHPQPPQDMVAKSAQLAAPASSCASTGGGAGTSTFSVSTSVSSNRDVNTEDLTDNAKNSVTERLFSLGLHVSDRPECAALRVVATLRVTQEPVSSAGVMKVRASATSQIKYKFNGGDDIDIAQSSGPRLFSEDSVRGNPNWPQSCAILVAIAKNTSDARLVEFLSGKHHLMLRGCLRTPSEWVG